MKDSITFITNTKQSHKKSILELFEGAEEIIIAVGFFKDSGYNNIKARMLDFIKIPSTESKFFVGTGFGETTPSSLKQLHKLIKVNQKHKLILCTPDAGIFHPKIYLFRYGKNVTIITGSSNLTESGWAVNDEVSIKIETTIDSKCYIQITKYFDDLYKNYFVADIENLIEKYRTDLEEHNANYSKPKFRFRRKEIKIDDIDIPRLKSYYEFYKKSNDFIIPQNREAQYIEAKLNLEKIASLQKLNKKEFHNLFGPLVGHLGYEKLWHSGSIHRTTHKTLNYIPVFRELIRLINNNIDKPINIAYDNIMSFLNLKRKNKEISGIGQNIIAEILMSYDSTKYANINDNPIAVLSLLGKQFKSIQSFKGIDYQEYVELLSSIKKELKMNSFLEIDSFFNYVYWNLIEE